MVAFRVCSASVCCQGHQHYYFFLRIQKRNRSEYPRPPMQAAPALLTSPPGMNISTPPPMCKNILSPPVKVGDTLLCKNVAKNIILFRRRKCLMGIIPTGDFSCYAEEGAEDGATEYAHNKKPGRLIAYPGFALLFAACFAVRSSFTARFDGVASFANSSIFRRLTKRLFNKCVSALQR